MQKKCLKFQFQLDDNSQEGGKILVFCAVKLKRKKDDIIPRHYLGSPQKGFKKEHFKVLIKININDLPVLQ